MDWICLLIFCNSFYWKECREEEKTLSRFKIKIIRGQRDSAVGRLLVLNAANLESIPNIPHQE